jgi:MFS family permease
VLTRAPAPRFDQPVHLGILALYRISPLGTLGLAGVGLTNSAFWGMGAVYAKATGLSVADVALFMSVAIVAAAVCTWPLGRLSDRFDRRTVIIVVALGAGVAAVAAMSLAGGERLPFLAAVFAYGGLALSLYSLCVAHANDRLQPEQMVAASSGLMLCYGVGAILGPMSVGALMARLGPDGFFIYLALVHALVGALAIYRIVKRPS